MAHTGSENKNRCHVLKSLVSSSNRAPRSPFRKIAQKTTRPPQSPHVFRQVLHHTLLDPKLSPRKRCPPCREHNPLRSVTMNDCNLFLANNHGPAKGFLVTSDVSSPQNHLRFTLVGHYVSLVSFCDHLWFSRFSFLDSCRAQHTPHLDEPSWTRCRHQSKSLCAPIPT